jgi:hypothetical protein
MAQAPRLAKAGSPSPVLPAVSLLLTILHKLDSLPPE